LQVALKLSTPKQHKKLVKFLFVNLRLQKNILQGNPHLQIGLHTRASNLMDLYM